MDPALSAGAAGPGRAPAPGAHAWTHLHVHSQYTLLGATASIAHLVERAAADGLSHLALTDTNALYGAVRHARACREAGIQPLLGMSVSVALPEDLRTKACNTNTLRFLFGHC